MKRQIAAMLAMAMCVTALAGAGEAEAKAKPKLSKTSLSIQAGASKTVKVKNAKGAKVSWKAGNKKITIKKAGRYAVKITGKSAGKSVLTCKVKVKKTYSLKCRVTVKKKAVQAPKTSPAATNTAAPGTTAPATATPTANSGNPSAGTPSSAPTTAPGENDATKAPQKTELPPVEGSILESYKDTFGYMGSCLNYKAFGQLQDEKTLQFVKNHFNSFTLENEMKPEAILGDEITGITKEEAASLGYVVPETYTEDVVPKLDFDTIDNALKAAKDNGLKVRAHTLVWHSQTPQWFFAAGYDGRKSTTKEIMDARLEFYIRSVMKHVMDKEKELTGEAGSIVYTWDVVNEYLNRGNSPWDRVYGNGGMEPSYVKKAFQVAYSMVKEYGVQDKVALVNNDFDTYFRPDEIVALVNFINEGEEAKICNAIGMQSHVDITRPTLEEYGTALDKFLATGLEVQITELDVTINFDHEGKTWQYKDKGETDEQQAAFVSDFMKLVVKKQRERDKTVNPKGITGVTIWGLYDTISWRSACSPLLFKGSIYEAKPSYQAFLDAAK